MNVRQYVSSFTKKLFASVKNGIMDFSNGFISDLVWKTVVLQSTNCYACWKDKTIEIDKGTIPTGFATPTITCVLPRTGSHELLVLIKFRSRELETISKTFY